MAEAKKTNTLIEKSIFNRPETKKQKLSLKSSGLKKFTNSNEKRTRHRLPQCLRPKKNILIENPFSIGLRPKKQRLSLKKQFGSSKLYKFK